MFRFTIRDVLWLTVVVAVLVAWAIDHAKNRIDWVGVREQQRAYVAAKEEVRAAQMRAKSDLEIKAGVIRAAGRFGVSPLDIGPETKINPSLLSDE